ncbi:apolipoprotein N-acyltransferase [Arcticibacter tournemirensis]
MKRNYLLGFVSAFLLWLAWPPMRFTAPLLLIAFVPLLTAAADIIRSDSKKKGKKIFWLAGATFFVWNTSCIYWVFNSLHAVNPAWVAALISLIPFGLAAVLMTLVFWLYYRLRRSFSKVVSYAGLISFWIGYEYLHQSWDLAFPWMTLGNGFAEAHSLIQWYEYTGVYGGTLWVLIANILAFELASQKENTATGYAMKKRLSLVLAAWVILPITISLVIYTKYQEKTNPANIVVVQPNVDPYMKWGAIPSEVQVQQLIRLSDSLGQPNTEYFIWPETSIPKPIEEDEIRGNVNFLTVQNFLSKYKNGNVLTGIESYQLYDTAKTPTARFEERIGKYSDIFNTAVNIENSSKVQFYHKSKLVPGVEQMPFASALSFLKPVFAAFGGSSGGFGKQDKPSVFYTQSGMGVAPVICYESIWGEYVAKYVVQGAQFIAIVTNDGWWGNTSGKDQHMDYAKLRAIETRRWVARSANTGISCFINQRGDITKKSKWWEATALKEDINLNDDITFYVKHGDYIAWVGTVACGIFILLLTLRRLFGGKR